MRTMLLVAVVGTVLAVSRPAAAQTVVRPGPSGSQPRTGSSVGFRAYGIIDSQAMTAEKSFQAILGPTADRIRLVGVGGEVTDLWEGVFARVTVIRATKTGSRVFVDESGNVHPLNIPLTIQLRPIELAVGWRFGPARSAAPVMLRPFIGGGLLMQTYKETSDFASPEEETETSDIGKVFFGGIEVGIRMFKLSIEAQYRDVPDSLGGGGISKTFNETNLGGSGLRVTFGVGF